MRLEVEDPDRLGTLRLAVSVAGVRVTDVVLPEDRQIIVGGLRLHYLDWGGDGAPVVFLHGGGLNAHTFDLVCLALRGSYHCLSIDQRGHGDSEWSPVLDYDPRAHAEDVQLLADELGLEGFVLVGMSMGAMNSMAYAGEFGSRLAGLVLIDASPEPRQEGADRILGFLSEAPVFNSVEELVERSLRFNPRRNARLLRRSLLHNLRRLPDGRFVWKHDYRQWGEVHEERRRRYAELWDALPRIPCPTLLVRGGESDVFLKPDAEKMLGLLRDGRFVTVPGAGHTVQGDNPAGLVDVLLPFLDEVTRTRDAG